jgi:hypothetical protein
LFIGLYCIFYLITFIWILIRFYMVKRLCQIQTVVFMSFSILFLILSGRLTHQISKDSWALNTQMSKACDVGSFEGLLYDMNQEYTLSKSLLCGKSCPCNLVNSNITNVTTVQNGAYNAFRCPTKAPDSGSVFSEIFVQVETST